MRKYVLSLILLFLSFYACQDNELNSEVNTCSGFDDPIKEISWLKQIAANIEMDTSFTKRYLSISQASFNSRTVFFLRNCCPNCVTEPEPIYSCEQQVLGRLGVEIMYNDLKDQEIIYRPDNFECGL